MNLKQLIEDLAEYRSDDIHNDAVFNKKLAAIQDTLGQDDGGLAGMVFSEYESEEWSWFRYETKVNILRNYVESELALIVDEDRTDVVEEVCGKCGSYVSGEEHDVNEGYKRYCRACDTDLLDTDVNLSYNGETSQVGIGAITIPVYFIEEQTINHWTLAQVLECINADRDDDWSDYDATDWFEGWTDYIENQGVYSIPACYTEDYFENS